MPENSRWEISPGNKYIAVRNGTSLCAFCTPRRMPTKIRLLASHTDSPGLKLRPRAEIARHNAILLGVEVYGSPLLTSWLNRDLGIAGSVLFRNSKGELEESLVKIDKTPVTIPQLAVHLDREVNDKGLQLNRQEHLNAIAAIGETEFERPFLETLLREDLELEQLIAHDLFLYPLEKSRLIGYKESLLAGYRIDSLASVHAALTALLHESEPHQDELKMAVFWDHEEVGSQSSQGAGSTFFAETAERILNCLGGTREDYFLMLNNSLCLSIDLAHALHPNYAERHDPRHMPYLGQGVVLKSNAQQKYATNARTLKPIFSAAGMDQLHLQHFSSRGDMPCGSTIGPIHACQTGMPTADIGCGQLSMHSCRELMACQDHLDLCQLLENIFRR